MATTEIKPPYPLFADVAGKPLSGGMIFIGIANQEPINNPIPIFWDAALAVPASQPIETIGGYPARAGSPSKLFSDSDYSMTVLNANGELVFSLPSIVGTLFDVASIQNQTYQAFTTAGAAPNYTLTPIPAIGALANSQEFEVTFHAAGTTGSNTINVSGLGAKNLKQYDAAGAKQPAIITASMIARIRYDGTDWLVINPLPVKGSSDQILLQTYLVPGGGSVMFGLGLNLTLNPAKKSIVLVNLSGLISGAVVGQVTVTLRFGTGVAPVQGAAPVGTSSGVDSQISNQVVTNLCGWSYVAILSNLVQGTNYWLDIGVFNNDANARTITISSATAVEI